MISELSFPLLKQTRCSVAIVYLAELWMCYCNGVFPSPYLSLALISQTVEYFFLKKAVNGHLPSIHRLKEPQEFEPVPVFGKGVICAASNRSVSYFDAFLIYPVKIFPQGIKNVCCTGFTMLHQILPSEEPWSVFRGSPTPGNAYLGRIWWLSPPWSLVYYFLTPRFLLFHLPRSCHSPRGGHCMTTGGKRWLWSVMHAPVSSGAALYSCLF